MKDLLKIKYKIHGFVNYIFYFLLFILGFLVGFGFKGTYFSYLIFKLLGG